MGTTHKMFSQLLGFYFSLIFLAQSSALSRCPSDIAWEYNNITSSCYYVEWYNNQGGGWGYPHDSYSAESLCMSYHQYSDIVTLDSYHEKDLVLSMALYTSEGAAFWLRKPSNESLSSWVGEEPWDLIGNGDYCLFFNKGGWFADIPQAKYCYEYTEGNQVICELDGIECGPEHDRNKDDQPSCVDIDCIWSSWSDTGSCQCTAEGVGRVSRTRTLRYRADSEIDCGAENTEQDCGSECEARNCTWSDWRSEDCSCSYSSDTIRGSEHRHRYVMWEQNEYGTCLGEDSEEFDCSAKCNAVCQWQPWYDPCECSGLSGTQLTEKLYNYQYVYGINCDSAAKYESCYMDCMIPDIRLPDVEVVFAGMAAWMVGMMMTSVVYFIEFMFLAGIFLFLFALVAAYFILKPYIITPGFTGSKQHVI